MIGRRWQASFVFAVLAAAFLPSAKAVAQTSVGVTVRYPGAGQQVVPDSNFIFGQVEPPDASLEIDGVPVDVAAGGGFLAWLPVPEATNGRRAAYEITVRTAQDTLRSTHPVVRPPAGPPEGAPRPWLAPNGLGDQPVHWVRPGERTRFEFVAEEDIELTIETGALALPVRKAGDLRGTLDRYAIDLDLADLRARMCASTPCPAATEIDEAPGLAPVVLGFEVVARAGDRVQRDSLRIPLDVLTPDRGIGARLREAEDRVNGRSEVVVARPTAFGPYRWRLADRSTALVTGRRGARVRLDLGDGTEAWVLTEDVEWIPAPIRPARTFDARVGPADGDGEPAHVRPVSTNVATLRVGLTRAVPAHVVPTGSNTVSVWFFGTYGSFSRIAHGVGTGIESVTWAQLDGPVTRMDITLEAPVWGYRAAYEAGVAEAYEGPDVSRRPEDAEEATIFRLDLRKPPALDEDPLRGLTIAIDPGHPGGGSTGPTGLFEGDANLAVAEALEARLRAAGAQPILVREGTRAVGLYERTDRARAAGAELFISIHNNALPDGQRPEGRVGTTTYYHHPHALALAEAVQRGTVERLGLPDLGVVWGDLAVAREAWMPSILVEGAFMIVPEHEAALRTPDFQRAYAEGVVDGIRAFLEGIRAVQNRP